MKLSLNWLKDYVDIDMSPEDLAHLLTMGGLEVERIDALGQYLNDIVVAKILSVKKHPKGDRLFICQVDAGSGTVPVVCGASNLKDGILVPMALPGTRLPGGMVVNESRIRGERSIGMLLAEDEMGLTDDHSGIMILPDNLAAGARLSSVFPLEDYALDIKPTPNRPDCSSVIGIAREVAALTGRKIRLPRIDVKEGGVYITRVTSVTVTDIKGCPRYAAGMIQGVELKPSPFWMRYRLHVSGIRHLNNVVDVSNYILLEMGQPLHTFDYDRLGGHRIVVSRAKEGDLFITLDGQARTLNKEHLMICDEDGPVALAGIMGGRNSEIYADSKNILIESAYFDPVTIRRGSRSLGLSTEASYRFERGTDIDGVTNALNRALMLMSDLAGGVVNKGIIDVYPRPYHTPVINLSIQKTNDLLGSSFTKKEVTSYIKALEMGVTELDDQRIQVKPPSFRVDISREVDLMEEIARLGGYDKIKITYPSIRASEEPDLPSLSLYDKVSEIMTGIGFNEIITYSFISPDSADMLGAKTDSRLRSFVKIRNPLTIDQSVMRTSLIPGMLSIMKENIAYGEKDLKLFEWGEIFIDNGEGLPHERLSLTGLLTGLYRSKEWHEEARKVDFYDIKGAVELLLRSLGIRDISFIKDEPETGYDPRFSCRIRISDSYVGSLGRIDPAIIQRYDIKTDAAYLFEIDIEALLEIISNLSKKFEPFIKYPSVIRDLSIIVDRKTESALIDDIIRREGKELIESVKLFDLYKGKKMGHSKKTLSFRICYKSREGTLDGDAVNRLHEKIINRIMEETGGTLSGA
jgi:phenylalanyl-tRNA synthetase beta chain